MYKSGDTVELKIEKMVYEGYGLSHKDGFVFFVDNVCDEDIVEAKITKIKKNFAFAEVEKFIEKSKHRTTPFCPVFNACGGCQWQYINYEHQLKIKQNIVKEIISKALNKDIDVKETIPSPNIKEFRHKIQMPVSQTKNSKRFLIGYYKKGSHDITNIKYCPIQPDIINKITEKIREYAQMYDVSAYSERTHKGELRHVIFRISEFNGDILICFVVNNNKISKQIKDLSSAIFDEFTQIKGVSVNFNQEKNNVILGKTTENLFGEETYKEKIGEIEYIISPESFFQINPSSFKNILDKVKEQISQRTTNPTSLDAYSGVGSFGLYLSDISKNITCVEEIDKACKNAQKACGINNIKNIEVLNGDAQKIFEDLIKNDKKFDVTILDPPRKGCTKEALDYCSELTNKFIVYVSCNPNSLARDLKYLKDKGFELSFIQTADMFCHTYHVETIAIIEKQKLY